MDGLPLVVYPWIVFVRRNITVLCSILIWYSLIKTKELKFTANTNLTRNKNNDKTKTEDLFFTILKIKCVCLNNTIACYDSYYNFSVPFFTFKCLVESSSWLWRGQYLWQKIRERFLMVTGINLSIHTCGIAVKISSLFLCCLVQVQMNWAVSSQLPALLEVIDFFCGLSIHLCVSLIALQPGNWQGSHCLLLLETGIN